MSIRDIIKSSFINQFSSDLSIKSVVLMLFVTAVMGVYIFFVYRQVVRKAFYSKSFAISLVVIAMITSMIILTVQSNIVISLGMVGALSIVRFRTAIKEPMDLAFLFWTISIGIICGAGIYEIAILGSLAITAVIMALHFVPNVQPLKLLIINASNGEADVAIMEAVKAATKKYDVKTRKATKSGLDMILEVKGIRDENALIKTLLQIGGVDQATIMTHNGDTAF